MCNGSTTTGGRKQDRHEIEFAFQHKTIPTIMGVFFQNVAA